jgi:CHAT domain-containing protein
MAQLCSQANDDFEALKLLREAKGLLQWGNITAPTEADLDTALTRTEQHFRMSEEIEEAYTWESFRQEVRLRLAEQGVSNPSEEDVNNLILSIHSEHLNRRKLLFRPLETLIDVNSLYLQLYFALANALFENDPEQAQDYLRCAEALHRMNLGNQAKSCLESIQGRAQPNVTDAPAALDMIHARLELDKIFLDHRTRPPEAPRYDLMERIEGLLPIVRTFSDSRILLFTLIRKADILLTMGENEQAIQLLTQTDAEVGDSLQHKLAPRVRLLLAKAYAGRQAWEQVTAHCEAGIQLVERTRAKINLPYLYSAYLREYIDLYALGVRATYERYKQSVNPDYGSMLRFAELSKSQFALRYEQTNLAAKEGWQYLRGTFLQTCKEIDALQADSEQKQARLNSLNSLLETRRRCSEELFFAITDAPRREFNLPDVQNTLDPDEAILYYYWLDSATLLIVTLDRERIVPELRTISAQQREKVEKTASDLLSAKEPHMAGLKKRVKALSWLLPQESAAIACLQSKQRLLISAHRALHAIPFHALSWQNEYLIQRFAVSYIPNLTSIQLRYVPLQTQDILILGVKDYALPEKPLRSLPGAELEAKEIAAEYTRNAIPVTLLRGAEANEQHLRDLLQKEELSRYRCLHIALHGNNIEGDSPLESFLCLYNSRLEGPEIAFWQLNAECVFLSACCSGQRAITGRFLKELPGDELLGLQAVFFLAGARRILGALWPVHDRAGQDIAVAFHRHYARGARAECALQQAIREYLAAEGSFARMDHWASLFLAVLGRPKLDNV